MSKKRANIMSKKPVTKNGFPGESDEEEECPTERLVCHSLEDEPVFRSLCNINRSGLDDVSHHMKVRKNPDLLNFEPSADGKILTYPTDIESMHEDGNCFYAALSLALYLTTDCYMDMKTTIAEFLAGEGASFYKEARGSNVGRAKAISSIAKDNVWADDFAVAAAAQVFNVNIALHKIVRKQPCKSRYNLWTVTSPKEREKARGIVFMSYFKDHFDLVMNVHVGQGLSIPTPSPELTQSQKKKELQLKSQVEKEVNERSRRQKRMLKTTIDVERMNYKNYLDVDPTDLEVKTSNSNHNQGMVTNSEIKCLPRWVKFGWHS